MIQKQSRIRAVTTLAMIISIMAAASSSVCAQSQPQSWYDGVDARLGHWSGTLGLNYMNGTQSMSSPDGSASSTTTNAFRESLRIANSGFYVVSPLLFTGNLALDLQLNQDRSGGSENSTAVEGKTIGYAFDATFLAEQPYTASVFANRNQIQVLQPSGGRMVGISENRGAGFHLRQDSILQDWGYPWVEANLDIHQENNQNTTTSFGHSLSTEEQNRTLAFNASKGFETADLRINYQLNDKRNPAFSQGNFQSMATGLVYSLDFGPTLNRRFDSMLNYATRNGVAPSTMISNNEHLHIDHYRNLSTDYQYGFNRMTADGISTTAQNGGFTVSHQLYQNLTTSAGVNGSHAAMPNGSTMSYGGQLGQGYHHSLPGKGNFSANWSGSYQLTRNDLGTSSISVIDEAHNAPTPLGAGVGFLLGHNFAVATTIVVTNVRGGGRIPTSIGVDYDVIALSNQITIVPLAGSLLIAQGDPLAVSYDYQVDANLKLATTSSRFGMGIDYRWISISFGHQQSTQTPLSQTTSLFLQSTQQNLVQINLQGTLLEMAANANMDFENSKSTTTAYDQTKVGATLVRQIQSSMRLIFGLTASETKYTLPAELTNSSRSARSSLNWFTAGGWSNTATVDWSNYQSSTTPPETLVQAIAQSSITLGLLSLNANIALGQWLRNDSRATNRSINIALVRQL